MSSDDSFESDDDGRDCCSSSDEDERPLMEERLKEMNWCWGFINQNFAHDQLEDKKEGSCLVYYDKTFCGRTISIAIKLFGKVMDIPLAEKDDDDNEKEVCEDTVDFIQIEVDSNIDVFDFLIRKCIIDMIEEKEASLYLHGCHSNVSKTIKLLPVCKSQVFSKSLKQACRYAVVTSLDYKLVFNSNLPPDLQDYLKYAYSEGVVDLINHYLEPSSYK